MPICRYGLLLVAAAVCGSAAAQDVPREKAAFTDYVAAQVRREVKGMKVEVRGPLTLSVGPLQANLDRVYAYCSDSANAKGCPREISSYVKSVAHVLKDQNAPVTKDAVRIIVRTTAYVKASAQQKVDLQPRPLAGELVMLPALDTPRAIRPLIVKDNEDLGFSADEVFKLGLANLRTKLQPLMKVAKPAQPGQLGYITGDAYHSSRLALHESWSALAIAQGGKLVVCAPSNDTVVYVGDDTPKAIQALRVLAGKLMPESPSPLSGELLRWKPEGWEMVR